MGSNKIEIPGYESDSQTRVQEWLFEMNKTSKYACTPLLVELFRLAILKRED